MIGHCENYQNYLDGYLCTIKVYVGISEDEPSRFTFVPLMILSVTRCSEEGPLHEMVIKMFQISVQVNLGLVLFASSLTLAYKL